MFIFSPIFNSPADGFLYTPRRSRGKAAMICMLLIGLLAPFLSSGSASSADTVGHLLLLEAHLHLASRSQNLGPLSCHLRPLPW